MLWQWNLCLGFDRITTSQKIRSKPLSLATALEDWQQHMSPCVALRSLATCSANPAPFGGRLNTTAEYAVRAVQTREGLAEEIPGAEPPEGICWVSMCSIARYFR